MPMRNTLNKGAQQPGPTMQGWGRSVQKRRLEYETVDSKYHKREFNKNWDMAGTCQRSTEFMQMRVYFRYPSVMYTWFFNQLPIAYLTIPAFFLPYGLHLAVKEYDHKIQHAAWW